MPVAMLYIIYIGLLRRKCNLLKRGSNLYTIHSFRYCCFEVTRKQHLILTSPAEESYYSTDLFFFLFLVKIEDHLDGLEMSFHTCVFLSAMVNCWQLFKTSV